MMSPLQDDTLVALRILVDFLGRYQDANVEPVSTGDGESEPSDAEFELYRSPLIDLLWGSLSWRTLHLEHFEWKHMNGQTYQSLLSLLFENKIHIDCFLCLPSHRDDSRILEEKMSAYLESCTPETHAQYAQLSEKGVLTVNLTEGKELIDTMFAAYRAMAPELLALAHRNDIDGRNLTERRLHSCRFLPPSNFLPQRKYLFKFFSAYFDEYLTAFEKGLICWDSFRPKNVWTVAKQKQYVMDCLYREQESYGDTFWLSVESMTHMTGQAAIIGPPAELKPFETLFSLEREQSIAIERIVDSDKLLQFKITILPRGAEPPLKTMDPDSTFRFLGTSTDFATYLLSQEGYPEKHQKMKKGKQRYLWQFLWTTYGAEPQPRTAGEKYVSEKIGRNVLLTEKDFENLIATLSSFSAHPREEIRKAFVIGQTIGLKKID
ncbi:MAG: hypothetical protein PHE68_02565 [Candidatus Peribacteraceae bacterium]|nr:hypothetical protein [Candidatus Peribacteraceae bacterium]